MKRSGIAWKVSGNSVGKAARAGAALLLPLLLCLAAKGSVSAQGKAYVAVFYRTFKDAEDPEAADVRAALNEALADAGIAYREYDGGDDPLIQLAQIVQEQDAMLLIVNPAEQGPGGTEEKTGEKTEEETEKNTVADIGADVAADIIVQTDGRPLIFFGCEISEETADGAEELCVLVNAAEPETETGAELETEIAGAEAEIGTEPGTETGKEIEPETGITGAEAEAEPETEITGAEAENETETEIGSASEPPKKNLQGMADAIALIAGNYMTGAGYFEGIEKDWITDEWRVDVPCLFLK